MTIGASTPFGLLVIWVHQAPYIKETGDGKKMGEITMGFGMWFR